MDSSIKIPTIIGLDVEALRQTEFNISKIENMIKSFYKTPSKWKLISNGNVSEANYTSKDNSSLLRIRQIYSSVSKEETIELSIYAIKDNDPIPLANLSLNDRCFFSLKTLCSSILSTLSLRKEEDAKANAVDNFKAVLEANF